MRTNLISVAIVIIMLVMAVALVTSLGDTRPSVYAPTGDMTDPVLAGE